MFKLASLALAFVMVTGVVAMSPAAASMQMYQAGEILIHNPWARATASKAGNGAAFITLMNSGSKEDRLISAATSVDKKTVLHTTIKEGNVMRMRHVPFISIPAGGMVELKPGGYHIMLMGLHAPLKEGESFPLTLTFKNSGSIEIMVQVKGVGAMDSTMDHNSHGTMKMKSE